MDKKGIVFTRPRDTVSFFIGLLLFVFGLVPLLIKLSIIGWKLPGFLSSLPFSIAMWIIAVAGLYVVIDGFIEPPAHNLHWMLIVAGIVLFVIGLLPILFSFGIIGFDLGGLLTEKGLLGSMYVYMGVITLEGLLLMVGGLTEH